MRPIDADALISDLEYDVDLDERALDCTDIVEPTRSTIQFDKDCKSNAIDLLKNMPTVEAIPVEWINKYTNEHRTYMHAFSEMVACWYDEKEKREYEMASDMRDYCEKYEPTYNPEDGSL